MLIVFKRFILFWYCLFFERLTSKIFIILKYFFRQSAKHNITHYWKLCETENSDSLLKMLIRKLIQLEEYRVSSLWGFFMLEIVTLRWFHHYWCLELFLICISIIPTVAAYKYKKPVQEILYAHKSEGQIGITSRGWSSQQLGLNPDFRVIPSKLSWCRKVGKHRAA